MRRAAPVALIAVLVVLVGCQSPTPVPVTPPPAPASLVMPSPSPSPLVAVASASPTATDQALPNPGGTCTAAQFIAGEATVAAEPSTLFTQHVLVFENLRNTGAACVLAQPKIIGLAAGTGPFIAASVPSLGQLVTVGNTGHYVYPASYPVRAGQSFRVDLNASWWFAPGGETPPGQFPCHDPIGGIDRAEVPLASGVLEVAWSPPFGGVCTTPPTVSIGFEFK